MQARLLTCFPTHPPRLPSLQGTFDEPLARLYAAEIVLAIAHLHSLGFVHRWVGAVWAGVVFVCWGGGR